MAVVEHEKKELDKPTENKNQYRVTPRYGVWTEKDHVFLQIALPGVSKDNIEMKALQDLFTLRARRNDIVYVLDLDFGISLILTV